MQKGDYCNGRLTYLEVKSEKQSDDDFSGIEYKDHQTGTSHLLELNVGLVSRCILNRMHHLLLEIVRCLILYLMKEPKSSKQSSHGIGMISNNLLQITSYVPVEFTRKQRLLTEVDRWEASEFRQFILYTGILAVKSVIETEFYIHFLYVFVAVYTLSSSRLCWHYAGYAKDLLELSLTVLNCMAHTCCLQCMQSSAHSRS